MSPTSSTETPAQTRLANWLARSSTYVYVGLGILALDLLTGPFLQFPILFVLPVCLCAWYSSIRWAYALAVLLPLGRFFIAEFLERPHPLGYMLGNMAVRIVVLLILAFFVGRTARQTKQLQERVAGLVTVCAWSGTIEYEGEWLSFEKYLKRRFDIDTSHGISPEQAEKVFDLLDAEDAKRRSEQP